MKKFSINNLLILVLTIFFISGCSLINDNKDGIGNVIRDNNIVDKIVPDEGEEIFLGDCVSTGNTMSSCNGYNCSGYSSSNCPTSSGCCYWRAPSGGNSGGQSGGGPTEPVIPSCEGNKIWNGSSCVCPGDTAWVRNYCREACSAGYSSTKDDGYEPCEIIPISGIAITGGDFDNLYLVPSEATALAAETGDAYGSWSGDVDGGDWSNKASLNIKYGGADFTSNKINISVKNDAPSSASRTISFYVSCKDWSYASGLWKINGSHPHIGGAHSGPGCVYYDNALVDPITGRLYWSTQANRCCSNTPEAGSGGTGDLFYCYGDQPYIGLATNVMWTEGKLASNSLTIDGKPAYRYDDIHNKNDCVVYSKPNACSQRTYQDPPVNIKTDNCEQVIKIENDENVNCGNNSTPFYTITCHTKVNTEFDMDDNVVKSNYIQYAGQGFKYNVGINENVSCHGTFNANVWNDAYGEVIERLKTVKPTTSTKGSGDSAWDAYKNNHSSTGEFNPNSFEDYLNSLNWEYLSNSTNYKDWIKKGRKDDDTLRQIFLDVGIAIELEDNIIDYNNYEPPESDPEETSIKMAYSTVDSNGKKLYSANFVNDTNKCNTIKTIVNRYNIPNKPFWVETPTEYYKIYNKVVNLYPKLKYIRKVDGSVTEEIVENEAVLEGGNKIYLKNNTAAQTIKLEIVVSNLARNGSTISNDKCELIINDVDLLYRPVELKNPFINDTWKIGDNWKNSIYDFRKTIHANTWSQKSLYVIDIPKEMVDTIKNSNRINNSAYLGVCDDNNTFQDAGTEYICQFIK